MFDQGEISGVGFYERDGKLPDGALQYGFSYHPWLPCPVNQWCGKQNDRVSASLINKQYVEIAGKSIMFTDGPGYVLNPEVTEIFCSFIGDGGTMAETENHGCSSRRWCDPTAPVGATQSVNAHQCPWHPKDFKRFMNAYLAEAYGHNELLVSTAGWEAKLPDLIQAIVWAANGPNGLGAPQGEQQARAVHKGFMRMYPDATTALLKLDILGSLNEPFTEM